MRKESRIVTRLLDWFGENARDLPWRTTRDPYAIWVSEIMLQQTQVKTVLPYWERWMQTLPDTQSLAKAAPQKIHKLWEGLGYYTRVRNMQRAARVIVEQHGGKFPRDFDAVVALPGIGRYTAGAICSIAFNQPTPILDGNVIRVLTRVFGISGDPREKKTNARLWKVAQELVNSAESHPNFCNQDPRLHAAAPTSRNACSDFNQSLMELGALVCIPKNPRCSECPLKFNCIAHRKQITHLVPNLPRRAPATARRFMAFVTSRNSRYFVRQRGADVVNAHLWEFPNIEVNGETDVLKLAHKALGFRVKSFEPIGTIKHTITRYRITLDVFQCAIDCSRTPGEKKGRWLPSEHLRTLPFTGAHKRILAEL